MYSHQHTDLQIVSEVSFKKNKRTGTCGSHLGVIWEAEIRRIVVRGQSRQTFQRPISKITRDVVQNGPEMWLKRKSACFAREKPRVQTRVPPKKKKKSKKLETVMRVIINSHQIISLME
jgi:hypothetical protein